MLGMAAGWIGVTPWAFISDQSFLLVDMTRFHSDGVFANLETAYIQDPHIFLIAAGWVLGHLLGYLLLGIARVRSGVVPVSQACCLWSSPLSWVRLRTVRV